MRVLKILSAAVPSGDNLRSKRPIRFASRYWNSIDSIVPAVSIFFIDPVGQRGTGCLADGYNRNSSAIRIVSAQQTNELLRMPFSYRFALEIRQIIKFNRFSTKHCLFKITF